MNVPILQMRKMFFSLIHNLIEQDPDRNQLPGTTEMARPSFPRPLPGRRAGRNPVPSVPPCLFLPLTPSSDGRAIGRKFRTGDWWFQGN